MELDPQKNFYDDKRYFMGKDNPGDPHPEPLKRAPIPMGQVVFGVVFLAFVAFLAVLNIKSAREEGQLQPAPAAAPIQATK